jgi:prepilin-type N-terminal cleavage/methylation domain-containing protein
MDLASPDEEMMKRHDLQRRIRSCDHGFTVVELSIALSALAVIAAVSIGAFRQYAEATSARKAAVQIAADVGLTRSFAIQRRANVSLVVDESNLTYVVQDDGGTVLMRRDFGVGSEMPLSTMVLNTTGDSLTFNSRGLIAQGAVRFNVGRRDHAQQVDVNALGRTTLN